VEALDPTSKSITVSWRAPDCDGGCAIQGYILEKMVKDGDQYERVNQSLVPGFSLVVKDLQEDVEYQFRVRAENAAGVSEPSRSTQLIKAADPVGRYRIWLGQALCTTHWETSIETQALYATATHWETYIETSVGSNATTFGGN